MLEEYKNLNERNHTPQDIQNALKNLGLDLKDFKGKVLDIGAGDVEILDYLNKNTEADIVGIDIHVPEELKDKLINADVRELPFPDNTFDVSFSHASIPNVFIGEYSFENPKVGEGNIYNSTKKALSEIFRTLKFGGTAYLAPISMSELYDSEKAQKNSLEKVINELRLENKDIQIDLNFIETKTDEYNNETRDYYRLVIYKIPDVKNQKP